MNLHSFIEKGDKGRVIRLIGKWSFSFERVKLVILQFNVRLMIG